MITDKDIQKLKQVFSTKDDLVEQLKPIKVDISTLKTDVSTLKTDVSTLKTDVSTIKKDVSYIRKTTELTLKYIDEENKPLKKRIEKVETHLGLETPQPS